MSMRLIATLACCTLAMGLMTGCKSNKSGSAGAMNQCDAACKEKCEKGGKCDGKCDAKCEDKAASMGQVGAKGDCCKEKAGACAEKKDGSMGAVSGEGCSKAGSCSGKSGC